MIVVIFFSSYLFFIDKLKISYLIRVTGARSAHNVVIL